VRIDRGNAVYLVLELALGVVTLVWGLAWIYGSLRAPRDDRQLPSAPRTPADDR
jgi:hypothetical protein